MKVLYGWLKELVAIDADPADVAERLTMAGLEVEGIASLKDAYAGLRACRIVECRPHPDAERLSVCTVDSGDGLSTVVCGAPNARTGLTTILAPPGGKLPGMTISTAVIRGVESAGMLCSEKELGIAIDSTGIIELDGSVAPGTDITKLYPAIDDVVFEIGITPNRGDCLSHRGIARELSAIYGVPLLRDDSSSLKTASELCGVSVVIEAPALCPRYTATVIRNVTIRPSSDGMRFRLAACGMRPINNIVDATNYVMLELGQPLHAFDLGRIEGGRIIVRAATDGETITTLDGKDRVLTASDIVIADGRKAVALAGVMGGGNSEVGPETRDILLESAFFNPPSIRKTARRLALQSEASYRFERSVDIENVPAAGLACARRIAMLSGGSLEAGLIDNLPAPVVRSTVGFRPSRCNAYLGTNYDTSLMQGRLASLGFGVDASGPVWIVDVPSCRTDVSIEEDLYEEVARLGFYHDIEPTLPPFGMQARTTNEDAAFDERLKTLLSDTGCLEVITYSFVDDRELPRSSCDGTFGTCVRIMNPLAESPMVMRPSLVPGMLLAAERNHARRNFDFALFEHGRVYGVAAGGMRSEVRMTAFAFSGLEARKEWNRGERAYDFFTVKGYLEGIIRKLGGVMPDIAAVDPSSVPWLHPARSCMLSAGGRRLGVLGALHPDVAARYDFKRPLWVAELDTVALQDLAHGRKTTYGSFSRYPSTERDLTAIITDATTCDAVVASVRRHSSPLLSRIDVKDLFRPEQSQGTKNLTITLVYQAMDRTLSDDEVNTEYFRVMEALAHDVGATYQT